MMSRPLSAEELDRFEEVTRPFDEEPFPHFPFPYFTLRLIEEARRLHALADDPEAVERGARAARIEEVRSGGSEAMARRAADAWDSGEANPEVMEKHRLLARTALRAALNPQEEA